MTNSKHQVRHQTQVQTQPLSKHTLALLTFFGLLPLVYFIPMAVETLTIRSIFEHRLITTIISVALIVPVISYVYLPLAVKLLSRRAKSQRETD